MEPVALKRCKKCGQDKPLTEFHNSARAKDGKWYYCKTCSNARALSWYHENKDSPEYRDFAFRQRLKRYNLDEAQYDQMLAAQRGGCAVCGNSAGELVIDHDHGCCPSNRGCCGRCVRGLLCHRCNRVFGNLDDSVELVRLLLKYAEAYA